VFAAQALAQHKRVLRANGHDQAQAQHQALDKSRGHLGPYGGVAHFVHGASLPVLSNEDKLSLLLLMKKN